MVHAAGAIDATGMARACRYLTAGGGITQNPLAASGNPRPPTMAALQEPPTMTEPWRTKQEYHEDREILRETMQATKTAATAARFTATGVWATVVVTLAALAVSVVTLVSTCSSPGGTSSDPNDTPPATPTAP